MAGPVMAESTQDGVDVPSQTPVPVGTRGRGPRWALRGGLALLGCQAVFLVKLSIVLFERFGLGIDFGIFSQAWTQIGTGHLDPVSTVNGFPYLRSHFELLMWPLALLQPLVHSPLALLFVQDAALVGTGVIVLLWVSALTARSALGAGWSVAIITGTVLLLVIDPIVYATAAEDFHFEPVATFFVVFAAYDLWAGRTGRLWIWIVLCLLCGDVGGLYVLGLGLTGVVACRGARVRPLLLLLIGGAWVGMISALGANAASDVSTGYAYLAGRRTLPGGVGGLRLLAGGVVGHPDRAWDMLWSRWGVLFRYLEAGGGVGVLTPWGFGVPLVALSAAALQADGVFLTFPFQNVVVVPFVTFGSAWLVVWIAARWRSRLGTAVAAVVAVGVLVAGGAEAIQQLPTSLTVNATDGLVGVGPATALGRALAATPAGAEVLGPVPVLGRFGARARVYPLIDQAVGTTAPVPVRAPSVMVVIDPSVAPQLLPPSIAAQLEDELVARGARVVVHADGVTAVLWHPPPGVHELRLP